MLNTRISYLTQANANLLAVLGDLVSSDGAQSVRVPLGTPGQVLTVDLTTESGLAWGSGADVLTFSDGVTRTLDNVTNDLVTGTPVAGVDAVVHGSVSDTTLQMDASSILLTAGDNGAGQGPVILNGGTVNVVSEGALNVSSVTNMHIDATGTLFLTGNGLSVVSNPATQLFLTSGANTNQTVGGAWLATFGNSSQFTGGAAADFNIVTATTGDIHLSAGTGGSGSVILDGSSSPGSVVAIQQGNPGRPFAIFDGAGSGQQTVAKPAGGGTVDTEARTAINALIDAFHLWGFLSA